MKPYNKLLLVVSTSIMLAINPMSSLAQGKKASKTSNSTTTTKACNDKVKAWEIKKANLDPHKIKYDILGSSANISKFELCKCTDKSIVIREKIAKVQ